MVASRCRLSMSVGQSRWRDDDDGADAGDEDGGVEGGGVGYLNKINLAKAQERKKIEIPS